MTRLGKILVFVNAAFSFGMLAWAVTLYVNRVDWSDRRAAGDKPAGELRQRYDRLDELVKAFRPAEAAWRDTRATLLAAEAGRPADRAWYVAELDRLRKGDQPAQAIVFNQGMPVPGDPRTPYRPKLEPATGPGDEPLRSIAFYENELKEIRDMTAMELARYEKAIQEDTRLTNLLAGDDKANPPTKGLRQRIVEEREKFLALEGEKELVRPQLINAFVESQLVLRRADALKARIRELQGGVAAAR